MSMHRSSSHTTDTPHNERPNGHSLPGPPATSAFRTGRISVHVFFAIKPIDRYRIFV